MTAPPSFTVPITFFSLFSHPKSPLYLSCPPLFLIVMVLLISGEIHPNPGPIDSCSVCYHKVTWGNRSVQCANCFFWVYLSCSGLIPTDFAKSPQDTLGLVQCAYPPLKSPSPSYNLTPYLHPQAPTNPHLHLQIPTNLHLNYRYPQIPIFKNALPQNNSPPLIAPPTFLITFN